MSFGLLPSGFILKRLVDILTELENDFKSSFGPEINLEETEPLGIINAIYAERLSLLWELAQGVYNAFYPNTAEGISLDNNVAITNITRLPATKSMAEIAIWGTPTTVISPGFIVSVLNDSDSKFETISTVTLGLGIDEVQDITFSAIPVSGGFRLSYKDEDTVLFNFDATNLDLESALNQLSKLSEVTVSGDFSLGFTVTFTGDDGLRPQPELIIKDNTLEDSLSATIDITITETTEGEYQATAQVQALDTGITIANADSITVIETPLSGIDSVNNDEDAEIGREQESDADLLIRRKELLQRQGTSTFEGIRNKTLSVDNVTQALIIENETMFTDSEGIPPKSFKSIVVNGDATEIAQSIFDAKPVGIKAFGNISINITDSTGIVHLIQFSRPTTKDIYMIVNIIPNIDPEEGELYPVDGDAQIKQKILTFTSNFQINQDVIVNKLYTPINEVAGVIGVEILIGFTPNPTISNNLSIGKSELADFDSTRITVNS